jgi:hypothetical protein
VADGKISGSATAELQEESRVRATVSIEFRDLLIDTGYKYQLIISK